jgi:ADP-ribosylglycohydrolase
LNKNEKCLNAIRGCLIGGAAGDALGYPVEFMTLDEIYKHYPGTGITAYNLDNELGKGIISDDTQMTLFTAKGILVAATRAKLRGIAAPLESYIYRAYLDWLYTQTGKYQTEKRRPCWLTEIKELCVPRAPGNACISALQSGRMGTIEDPINSSKGCGSVMHVAPVALSGGYTGLEGARTAAITHGHPLGYMSAEALAYIINRIVHGDNDNLESIVNDCIDWLGECFPNDFNDFVLELQAYIELAIRLAQPLEKGSDTDNIARIGEGWIAEEALCIALYCAMKYHDDFSAAITAAVNHSGDSDSTGAITGNIVGALIGYEGISAKWKQNLQLHDLILEIANDLHNGYRMDETAMLGEERWLIKYGS